jgi:hypothetical protein
MNVVNFENYLLLLAFLGRLLKGIKGTWFGGHHS